MANRSLLSPRKEPSQSRSRRTVSAILDAATHIFARQGYGAATTARIAERAGVSVGSLYQYFPSKDAILVALGERHVEESHARIAGVLDELEAYDDDDPPSLAAILRALVAAMVDLHLADPVLHRLLSQEVPKQPRVQAAKSESEQLLLKRVERLLRRHPAAPVRSSRIAIAIAAQVMESLTHWYVIEKPELGVERDAFIDEITAVVCGYLERR